MPELVTHAAACFVAHMSWQARGGGSVGMKDTMLNILWCSLIVIINVVPHEDMEVKTYSNHKRLVTPCRAYLLAYL